jgi:hypothetical protein
MEKVEIWKDIAGFETKYQISNLGNVKSKKRVSLHPISGNNNLKEKILKKGLSSSGYYVVNLYNGKNNTKLVHKLVSISFLNHITDGHKLVIDHIDGNKLNNNLDNLQIISQRENIIKSKNKKNKTSNFNGVHFNKIAKKYQCQIYYNNKRIHLGYFKNELDAKNAYIDFLKEKEVKIG